MVLTKKISLIDTTIAEFIKERTDTSDFLDSLQVEQELLSGLDTDKVHFFIEDCISKKKPFLQVLRLLCIQSLTNSGLKPKVLEHYKREIVQTYGFQHFLTLSNLEKSGLLQLQVGKNLTNTISLVTSFHKTNFFLPAKFETLHNFKKNI